MTYEYTYKLHLEADGSALLTFRKFPEIVCEVTKSELQRNGVRAVAYDAVRNAIQARIDYQDEIPTSENPDKKEVQLVRLSSLDILKISLYDKYRSAGCSKVEFARRAATTPTGLARALDLYHASRFEVLIDIFDRLGFSVKSTIDVRPTRQV